LRATGAPPLLSISRPQAASHKSICGLALFVGARLRAMYRMYECCERMDAQEQPTGGDDYNARSSVARCRDNAHATCSRTSSDASSLRALSAAITAGVVGALPSATARLRSQLS